MPQVIEERTSSRVLTLEYLAGVSLKAFLTSGADNAERLRVSGLLIRALHGAFLVDGTVHADPTRNFLLLPDGRLGVLDFGA